MKNIFPQLRKETSMWLNNTITTKKKTKIKKRKNVMALCEAIKNRRPLEELEVIFGSTDDFEGCLLEAIFEKYPLEFIEKLFEKTPENSTDFDESLYWALRPGSIPLEFLEKLVEKTTHLTGHLGAAIHRGLPLEFLEKLFEKTVYFEGYLLMAIENNLPVNFLEKLFEKTVCFAGCLELAIRREGILWNF